MFENIKRIADDLHISETELRQIMALSPTIYHLSSLKQPYTASSDWTNSAQVAMTIPQGETWFIVAVTGRNSNKNSRTAVGIQSAATGQAYNGPYGDLTYTTLIYSQTPIPSPLVLRGGDIVSINDAQWEAGTTTKMNILYYKME